MANYALPLGSPIFKAAEADGTPLSGGKLFAYESDGVTPKTTWNSGVMSAETANINPVILDSRGEAWIFGTGLYLFVLKDSSNVVIWTSPPTLLLDVTDKARALLDDTSYSAMRTTLGLGTAAVKDAGSAAGEVVLLESDGKLPAVDGSQLTNLGQAAAESGIPRGYVDGLILSRSDATTLGIRAGECRDDGDNEGMTLSSALTKTLDSWVAGTGNGARQSGTSLDIDTWYHVFLIKNPTTEDVDVLFSKSTSSPTPPAGYSRVRRLGAFLTNASSQITSFTQINDLFLWADPVIDVNEDQTLGTTAQTKTLTVPIGLAVRAVLQATAANAAGVCGVYISNMNANDEQPTSDTTAPLNTINVHTVGKRMAGGRIDLLTNTSAQIRIRSDQLTTSLDIVCLGWLDSRGRDAP